jgi:hypothetical protein
MRDIHTPPAYFLRLIEIIAARLPQMKPEHSEISPGTHCVAVMLDPNVRANFGDVDLSWGADVDVFDRGEWWMTGDNISVDHASFESEPSEEQLQGLAAKIIAAAAEYVYRLMNYHRGDRVTLIAVENRPPYFTAAAGSTGVIADFLPEERILRLDLDEPPARSLPCSAPDAGGLSNPLYFTGEGFYDFPLKVRRVPS